MFLPFGKIVSIYVTNRQNLLNDLKGTSFRITIGISRFFTKRLNEFSFNNQYQSICD